MPAIDRVATCANLPLRGRELVRNCSLRCVMQALDTTMNTVDDHFDKDALLIFLIVHARKKYATRPWWRTNWVRRSLEHALSETSIRYVFSWNDAMLEQIIDPEVLRVVERGLIGSIDQWSDHTHLREAALRRSQVRTLYT